MITQITMPISSKSWDQLIILQAVNGMSAQSLIEHLLDEASLELERDIAE